MAQHISKSIRVGLAPLMLGALVWVGSPAQAASPTLSDLAFMEGHWQGPEEMGGLEEIWLPPAAGVMTGVMRWPFAGDSGAGRYVLELLTISEEDDGVIYRFKHFDPDITPWEKDRANTYRLTDVSDGCATFDGPDNPDSVPAAIQYCRVGEDTLVFRGAGKDQPIAETDFVLTFQKVAR